MSFIQRALHFTHSNLGTFGLYEVGHPHIQGQSTVVKGHGCANCGKVSAYSATGIPSHPSFKSSDKVVPGDNGMNHIPWI